MTREDERELSVTFEISKMQEKLVEKQAEIENYKTVIKQLMSERVGPRNLVEVVRDIDSYTVGFDGTVEKKKIKESK